MTLSYQQEQRIRRVAFRLAQDSDDVFDEAVERITELVLDAIDIERRRPTTNMDAEPVCIEKKWDSEAYHAACQRQERHEQRMHDNYIADDDDDGEER